MTFHVGQRVECVDDKPRYRRTTNLVKRRVYTIIECYIGETDGLPGVVLAEISPLHALKGYYADRFRPVATTDISVFTAMLAAIPRKELATAEETHS